MVAGTSAGTSPRLTLHHDVGTAMRIRLEPSSGSPDVELMRYVYRPTEPQLESPRPYAHPIRTRAGRSVTVFRPWDHVWHKGITMALPNVGPHNFWGGGTYTRATGGYADLHNNGSQDHESVVALTIDSHGAAFAHDLIWRTHPADDGLADDLITERRRITAALAADDAVWVLGWCSTLTNVSSAPIELGSPTTEGRENAGYGGLFWRGPRSFTGGYMAGESGVEGEALRGTAGDWAGFSGQHDEVDASSTVVFVNVTAEQDLDTKWFARSEPFACLNPAPFFETVRVLEPGETLTLEYAVAIADGSSDRRRMRRLADDARAVARQAEYADVDTPAEVM